MAEAEAFSLPDCHLFWFFSSSCSSRRLQFRDEYVACPNWDLRSEFGTFGTPLVGRLVGSSVKHGSTFVISQLTGEVEVSVPDRPT